VQRPRPPIYLGGTVPAALGRAGRRADGWLTLCMLPVFMDTDMMVAQRRAVDEAARAAGRDPASIETVMRVNVMPGVPAQQVADAVKSMREKTGFTHFVIETMFFAETVDASLETTHELMRLIDRG
jgi:alkanesulfonate monooxygenase SsuD/methylene tetrahydromethanopterin reductase-like flavin-dependent oxidoreductase (luciferase family)